VSAVRAGLRLAARSTWGRVLVTAGILIYLARQIDMGVAVRAVLSIQLPHLTLVLVLVAGDRLVMILRWLLLLRASDVPIAAREAARIFLVSSFVGSFLPAGIGSDAARAWSVTARTARPTEALALVGVDRLLGVLSLVAIGVAGAVVWTPAVEGGASIVTVAAVLGVASLGAFWADRIVRMVVPDHRHGGPVGRRLLKLSDAVSRYRNHRGMLLQVMLLSFAVQLLRIAQAYFLGRGLGIAVPFQYYLVFMPIGLLMLLLPISVSGFGLPQGVIVWLLRPMGVADERSFALSTLIVLTGLAGNMPGLWLWLRNRPRAEGAR
jgi:glycosyltransferase 2 family protein